MHGLLHERGLSRLVETLGDLGINDVFVLDAFRRVPRHLFVDPAVSDSAYTDVTLPLGYQQTLSQPSVVARMLELLRGGRHLNRVLEIGAGSGFQTGLLAHLAEQVFAIERIAPLATEARKQMDTLDLENIVIRHGDGLLGWPEFAPFDGIILAACPQAVPETLFDQLADGGRLIAPVGRGQKQQLILYIRDGVAIKEIPLDTAFFVPALAGLE
ncbi:MAG: protein-L-isoaspartate O-methyltransferase [Gammaproteobacteria bacterium]|nr:protein-L-isoaspartate O-methyltransferase [Gammaproteobacteria bacterium]HAN81442.1 protein-L-isoaspartate(D-aspartate) O-methyltransferase [Gammaproteobacteria bacterium]